MTKKEIIQKAIEVAVEFGWKENYPFKEIITIWEENNLITTYDAFDVSKGMYSECFSVESYSFETLFFNKSWREAFCRYLLQEFNSIFLLKTENDVSLNFDTSLIRHKNPIQLLGDLIKAKENIKIQNDVTAYLKAYDVFSHLLTFRHNNEDLSIEQIKGALEGKFYLKNTNEELDYGNSIYLIFEIGMWLRKAELINAEDPILFLKQFLDERD